MTRQRRTAVSVAKVVIVLAVIAGLLYAGLLLRWPMERPIGYWPIDESTLQVVVLDAPNLNCAVARVDESSDSVRIHVQCAERVLPVSESGMAQQYVFQVTLHAPLAGRTVYDGSGTSGQQCQKPAPDCWYSGP